MQDEPEETQTTERKSLLYDLFEKFSRVIIGVTSGAVIAFSAVWKVGYYFSDLSHSIEGLRDEVKSVRSSIDIHTKSISDFEARLSSVELKESVRSALEKAREKHDVQKIR